MAEKTEKQPWVSLVGTQELQASASRPLCLVAEDETLTREVIGRIVRGLGYPVIYADNGQLALEILEQNPRIEMLITDELMPKLTGTGLIRELRSRDQFRSLGIAIVSGLFRMQDVGDLFDMGVDRFVPKPVDAAMLRREVQSLGEMVGRRKKVGLQGTLPRAA